MISRIHLKYDQINMNPMTKQEGTQSYFTWGIFKAGRMKYRIISFKKNYHMADFMLRSLSSILIWIKLGIRLALIRVTMEGKNNHVGCSKYCDMKSLI